MMALQTVCMKNDQEKTDLNLSVGSACAVRYSIQLVGMEAICNAFLQVIIASP